MTRSCPELKLSIEQIEDPIWFSHDPFIFQSWPGFFPVTWDPGGPQARSLPRLTGLRGALSLRPFPKLIKACLSEALDVRALSEDDPVSARQAH